jgi:subtilase family serine protease
MKHRNIDALDKLFWAVSDPRSPRYGQFATREELEALVGASEESFAVVEKWLAPHRSSFSLYAKYYASIKIRAPASVVRELFQVPVFVYSHHRVSGERIRIAGEASVPAEVAQEIEFVAGLSEFIEDRLQAMAHRPRRARSRAPSAPDPEVTPALLRQYYQVPNEVVNASTRQGIAAFNDYFSMGALEAFDQAFSVKPPNVTRIGPPCFPDCGQNESDLDVQYVTAMGQGADTTFITQGGQYWILQFAEEVLSELHPLPYLFSISYGWSELAQCEIAVVNCPKFGYNSTQYVERTNQDLQLLGSQGVTLLVSDGDDGAPGFGAASGNCPIDDSTYCPTGGCPHKTSKCSSFTVKNVTSGELCFFPMGIGSDACQGVLQDPNANAALEAFMRRNLACGLTLEEDAYGLPHVWSSCACSSLQSVTSHGYTFSQYTFSPSQGAVFTADYPTSSPYVTSVGATQFVPGSNPLREETASILNGALITTGGGFSSFQPQPSYQAQAVAKYLASPGITLPPSFAYNPNMRAYPDVALNGHNYVVYYSNDTSDQCPCSSMHVDGTSASSPAFAGMITLVNNKLLSMGLSPLGFLNPLLYQMAQEAPEAFTDITSGSNRCNRAYCCIYGWEGAPGWDPVSGLGTINFPQFLDYVMKIKQQQQQQQQVLNA